MLPGVICNVSHLSVALVTSTAGDHIREVSLVNFHVAVVGGGEGGDLHVVAIGAAASHALQVAFEDAVDVLGRGWDEAGGGRVGSGILAFGISSDAAARVDVDELFVVVGMLTHVVYDGGANGRVCILVTVELVGEGVEQAVACRKERGLVCAKYLFLPDQQGEGAIQVVDA